MQQAPFLLGVSEGQKGKCANNAQNGFFLYGTRRREPDFLKKRKGKNIPHPARKISHRKEGSPICPKPNP
tara:strand:- start:3955 stop:4164 length:210 start_codon:yes stop_codon:yes gene_type:complete